MSIIERQGNLTKSLYEINSAALREYATLQQATFQKYVELNRSYFEKLPELREVASFVELQQEYGQSLWNGVQESARDQGEIVKGVFENTRDALKTAFNTEAQSEVEVAAAPKPRAKGKAKAESTK